MDLRGGFVDGIGACLWRSRWFAVALIWRIGSWLMAVSPDRSKCLSLVCVVPFGGACGGHLSIAAPTKRSFLPPFALLGVLALRAIYGKTSSSMGVCRCGRNLECSAWKLPIGCPRSGDVVVWSCRRPVEGRSTSAMEKLDRSQRRDRCMHCGDGDRESKRLWLIEGAIQANHQYAAAYAGDLRIQQGRSEARGTSEREVIHERVAEPGARNWLKRWSAVGGL